MGNNLTLNDIAKVLGLSKSTISLAINNDPRVAKKTRIKIGKKIKEMGYVYNRGAAGLSTGRTNTVGIAVNDLPNPFFATLCFAIESVFSRADRLSFLCNTNESLERQEKFIEGLIEHRADGLILCPAVNTTYESIRMVFEKNLPTVLIVRDIAGVPLDFVGNDGQMAANLATEHLINLGHTRIAMIGGGHSTSSALNRRAGFLAAMKNNNIPSDSTLLVDCGASPEDGEEGLRKALKMSPPPTAAVCLTDQIALGVISGLHFMNLTPGRDMAIASCDDISDASRGYMQLTTARIRKGKIGEKAAEMLLERIENPELSPRNILFKSELIVRKSCGS